MKKIVSNARTTNALIESGSILSIEFPVGYKYYAVINNSSGDIYVSTVDPECKAGGDDVMCVPSGMEYTHYNGFGGNNEIYLSGDGEVTVIAKDEYYNSFKSAQKGGGGGGGSYTLPVATTTRLGGVKVDGTTITADENGVISTVGGGGSGNGIFGGDLLFEADGIPGNLESTYYNLNTNLLDYDYIYITAIGRNTASSYAVTSGILPKKALVENNGNDSIKFSFDNGNSTRYLARFALFLSGTQVESNNGNAVISIGSYVSFLSIRGFKL